MNEGLNLRSIQRNITRPTLNVVFLLDVSGSMRADGRITSLNNLMRELPLHLRREADRLRLKLIMRAITFGDSAEYVVGSREAGVVVDSDYSWQDVSCQKRTATASAIELASGCLEQGYLGNKNRAPIIFLLTDGECTQPDEQFIKAVRLLDSKLGGRAIRVAIGVGDGYNINELKKFASFGQKPNAENKLVAAHYIYNVARKNDINELIADLTAIVAAGSCASIINTAEL